MGASSSLTQLPANAQGKPVENGPHVWGQLSGRPSWRLPASLWPNLDYCNHLESEPANEDLSPTFSNSAVQINCWPVSPAALGPRLTRKTCNRAWGSSSLTPPLLIRTNHCKATRVPRDLGTLPPSSRQSTGRLGGASLPNSGPSAWRGSITHTATGSSPTSAISGAA